VILAACGSDMAHVWMSGEAPTVLRVAFDV